MFDRNHSVDTKTKMSMTKDTPIFIYSSDEFILIYSFSSSKKASEFFNCSYATIIRYVKSGKIFQGQWLLSTFLISKK
jgi:hypothetical protein